MTGATTGLVIGLGNALRGDDGIGPAVIEALRPENEGLTLIESSGDDLLEWLTSDAFDRAIVVDAADLGQAPGCWARLTPAHLSADSTQGLTHGMGLAQSLEMAAALGAAPPISIYAVSRHRWTRELSRRPPSPFSGRRCHPSRTVSAQADAPAAHRPTRGEDRPPRADVQLVPAPRRRG
jgi:hydrogenase maturation protease